MATTARSSRSGAVTAAERALVAIRTPSLEAMASGLLLAGAILFNLYTLLPEVTIPAPKLNDGVLHLLALGRAVAALAAGQDPTDPWLPSIALGYPLFHYYQHFAYVVPAGLYFAVVVLLHRVVPLVDVFNGLSYLLLSLFPVSIYWSTRRLGFARLPAALAGLAASLLATNGLYGFDVGSYVWRGYGMYTQLWGMVLLPPTVAQGYVTLREGRGFFWTLLLLAATLMSHLVSGYIAGVSLVVVALLCGPRGALWRRGARLALLGALLALVLAYFLVPYLLDSTYMNRSVWEYQTKYDSYGAEWVLRALIRGELFDYGRFPSLTLLVVLGAVVCLWRWRTERYRVPLALGLVWLLLYFGRPTWGVLLDLLPLSRDMHFHRLIAGVHLAGIWLIGLGLALPWEWARGHAGRRGLAGSPRDWSRGMPLAAVAALTGLLLYPVYAERVAYLGQNAVWMAESRDALAAEQKDLDGLLETLRELPPGRVYAGLAATWGRQYRVGAVPMYGLLQREGFDCLGYLYHALSLNTDVQVLFDEQRPEQYNLFNVRYVVAPADRTFPSFVHLVGQFGRHRLYQVDTSGYFDLVRSDYTLVGDKSDFYPAAAAWLKGGQPGAKEHPAVLLGRVQGSYQERYPLARGTVVASSSVRPRPASGRIVSETVDSNVYRAQVDAARASTLMLKESFHPGWHAYLDGAEIPTVMLMPSYVGVTIPAGVHDVRFEYRPGPLHGPLLLLGLLTLALVGLAESRRRQLAALGWRLAGRWRQFAPLPAPPSANGLHPRADTPLLLAVAPSAVALPGPRLERQPGQPRIRLLAGLYLLFLSVYLLTAAGHFFSTDHVATYFTAQSLVEHGTLAIRPILDTVRGVDGRYYATFGIGQSLVSIPLYVLGSAVDHASSPEVRRLLGGMDLGQWGGTVPIFFVSLLNQIVMPLVCVLVFLFCLELGFSQKVSLASTSIFGFATSAWVYARDSFQHPLETLALLATLYILIHRRSHLEERWAALAGVIFGYGLLTRLNLAFVLPAITLYLLFLPQARPTAASSELSQGGDVLATNGDNERWRRLVAFLAPIVLALVCVGLINFLKFGSLLEYNPNALAKGFSTPLLVGLYGNLFSVGRSIFLYSPPVLLGVWGYRTFLARQRREAALFLAIAGIYLVVYSTYGFWDGGWAWGPRFLLATVPLLCLPMGYVLDSAPRRMLAALVALAGVLVQLLGVLINYDFVYSDWLNLHLAPENAYLFDPALSPLATHFSYLMQGRGVDVWLLWVYGAFGLPVFLLALALPLLGLAVAFRLLRPFFGSGGGSGGAVLGAPAAARQAGMRSAGATVASLAARLSTLRQRAADHVPVVGQAWARVRARLGAELPYLGAVGALTLLAGLPLMQFKLMSGHDTLEYLPRNVEFSRGLAAGQLLPRWAPDLNAGRGEPFFSFNPPVVYFVSALFHALGFSFVAAESLTCLTILLLAALGMYLLAGEAFGRRGGLVAAAAYLFAPYTLVVLYVRHALADFSAFAFLPFAFQGLYRFSARGSSGSLVVGSLAVALLALSSNPVALVTAPCLALLLAWTSWTRRDPGVLARGLWCLGLGLGVSAFFWLPALAERQFVQVSQLLNGYLSYQNHFVYPWQFLSSPWGYGLSLPGPNDGMSFEIGALHLVLALAALLALRRVRQAGAAAGLLVPFFLVVLAGAAFFASTLSGMVWDALPLLQYLEFPWRLLSLVAVASAFLAGFPLALLPAQADRWANLAAAGLIVGVVVLNITHAHPERFYSVTDSDYSPEAIVSKNIAVTTALEYLPVWVKDRPQAPAAEPLTLLAGSGRVTATRLLPGDQEYQVEIGQTARLRANTFYFPGWTLLVDGYERPLDYANPQGVMELTLEPGRHQVRLVFLDTPIRAWATRLSLLALGLLLAMPLLRGRLPAVRVRIILLKEAEA